MGCCGVVLCVYCTLWCIFFVLLKFKISNCSVDLDFQTLFLYDRNCKGEVTLKYLLNELCELGKMNWKFEAF